MNNPRTGRFITPDTIIPDYNNPQSLNRYSYVLNNPLKYIDPTGHESKLSGALWYDKVSDWGWQVTETAKSFYFENTPSNDIGIAGVTALTTAIDFSMGLLHYPAALGHLGEGTGTFLASPNLETAPGMLLDVSLLAGTLTTVGVQLNTKYYRYTGNGSKPTYNAQGRINNGTWLTRNKYSSFSKAENKLQIPDASRPITNVESVKVPWGKYVGGPNKVSGNPQWGQGNGAEYRVGGL